MAPFSFQTGEPEPRQPWQQTPGGRVILGTVLALGLCYGTLQIGMAVLRSFGVDAANGGLDPITGLGIFLSLQIAAVLAGGMLAGAGQDRGSLLGGFVGILSGVGVLAITLSGVVANLVESYSGELLSPGAPTFDLIMFGLPVQHLIVGAIGGLIGSLIWKPIVIAVDKRFVSPARKAAARRESRASQLRWTGPIAWIRVIIGTGIAILGALNTAKIVDFILRASDHKLQVVTHLETQVAQGEIFGLSILLGGCFAGATRLNGLKQGVCVGFLFAAIIIGTSLRTEAASSWSVLFPVVSALLLGPVGGWFGSELLPPVSKRIPRPRIIG
jgi:hypothetical protein